MSAFVLSLLDNISTCGASGQRKFDHISDVLRFHHWLPIRFPIEFKIAMLVFQCVSGKAPSYLRELVKPLKPTRNLRSGDNSPDLAGPRAREMW